MKCSALWVAAALFGAGPTMAQALPADAIRYHAADEWIAGVPLSSITTAPSDAPVQFLYLDNQVRVLADGTEQSYSAYRIKILKPEGLAAGSLGINWQPDSGALTVHQVDLVHDGRTSDVLAMNKFTVLQREEQLEKSMLTGQRTATLQVPGVQVGDEIAVAFTIQRRQPAFGGHAAGLVQLPVIGLPGFFRARILWPRDSPLAINASKDLSAVQPTITGADSVFDVTLRDPGGPIPTTGAPPRYNVRRLVEYSSFGSWSDVSKLIAASFERAAVIKPDSSLKAEAAAIATKTDDPLGRAQAALQFVEDRIRYVYIGLNGGDYIPSSAEETWKRRFGDCKAKAVLLVALLRELGIDAVPALVSSSGGDGMDQRLPSPLTFDHVIVRAMIAGRERWLDATRQGDRYLDNLPSPFRWALPLVPNGTGLEAIPPHDGGYPSFIGIADIDARAGVDQDAKVSMRHIIRGDEAYALRTQLTALSADDADRAIKAYWQQQVSWATPDKVAWSYDERRMAITLSLAGAGNPGWKQNSGNAGHYLTIPGAGFYAPDPMRRPADQDQTAPWAVDFPRFRCWATTIRLPKPTANLGWSLYADWMSQRLGGATYMRKSGLKEGVVRTVMSRQSYEAEATPAEAALVNRAIPSFNDNMSTVSETAPSGAMKSAALPFDDQVDWLNAPLPCTMER